MKVVICTNIPSPYRWLFWNQLGDRSDLTVLFECRRARNREALWYSDVQPHFHAEFLSGIQYTEENALSFRQLKQVLSRKNDIVVVGGYHSLTDIVTILALRLKHKPYLIDFDGAIIHQESHIKYVIKKYLIGGAACCMTPGPATDQFLFHYGYNPDKIRHYHFTSLLEKDIVSEPYPQKWKQAKRKEIGLNFRRMVISVGSFIHRKGFDVLLNACAELPEDIGVCIIGGEPTEEYTEIAEKYKLKNVLFFSHMGKEKLFDYYRLSDLFVFPTRYDIWGLVVNEAMSQGLPVITTTKCIAGLELVQNGISGYLVEPEDSHAIAERIVQLTEDENLCERMSRAALEKIRSYTIETMVKEYMSVFNAEGMKKTNDRG